MKKIIIKILVFLAKTFKVKNIIVLESNPDLSDNTGTLYDEIIEQGINNEYKIIWILKNQHNVEKIKEDFNVYPLVIKDGLVNNIIGKVKIFYYLSSCKYLFFSHQHHSKIPPKDNQSFVFLTHGVHFKNGSGRHFNPNNVTSVIATSTLDRKLCIANYGVSENQIEVIGYPRNDLLLKEVNNIELDNLKGTFEKILIWVPTFRRHKNNKVHDGDLNKEIDFPLINSSDDISKLNKVLVEFNYKIFVKPHPAQDLSFFKMDNLSNIEIIYDQNLADVNIKLYELLAYSDILITDYSSVFIDFLLTKKHIIFTTDDLDSYAVNPGFTLDNYIEYMPGSKANDLDQFVSILRNIETEINDNHNSIVTTGTLFHKNLEGNYTKELLNHFELIGNKK